MIAVVILVPIVLAVVAAGYAVRQALLLIDRADEMESREGTRW